MEPNREILRQRLRVCLATRGRKWPRHGNAQHILRSQRVHGNSRHHRRVNAAAEPNKNLGEAALPHIVARSRHQCAVRISNLPLRLLVDFAFPRCRIKKDEIFFKSFGLRRHLAVGRQRNAPSIENQAVVASHLIHVNHRPLVCHRNRAQHLETKRPLVQCVGRSGQIQQYRTSLPHNFAHRVAVVKLFGPKILVVPDVFADRDAQLFSVQAKHVLPVRRLKVARFIKNVVSRQKHFALLEDHAPVANQRRFVANGLPCSIFHASRIANHCGQRDFRRQLLQFAVVSFNKRGAFQQILGRVSAQAKLGKYGQRGAALLCLRR